MRSPRSCQVLPLILFLSVAVLASQAHAGKKDDTLNIATNQEITNVDKYFNASRVGTWIQHLGWDFLLHIDRQTDKIVPALASAFTPVFFKMNHDDVSHDPEITKWFTIGDTAMDPQVRLANYGEAYKKIAEQAYWLPMFTGVMNYVYVKDLDFKPTPDELPQFYNTRWK